MQPVRIIHACTNCGHTSQKTMLLRDPNAPIRVRCIVCGAAYDL